MFSRVQFRFAVFAICRCCRSLRLYLSHKTHLRQFFSPNLALIRVIKQVKFFFSSLKRVTLITSTHHLCWQLLRWYKEGKYLFVIYIICINLVYGICSKNNMTPSQRTREGDKLEPSHSGTAVLANLISVYEMSVSQNCFALDCLILTEGGLWWTYFLKKCSCVFHKMTWTNSSEYLSF